MTDSGWPIMASPASNGADASLLLPVIVGKAANPTTPANPMSRIRLSTLSDVAKEIRKLYREARAGTLPTAEATKLAYLLNMLAGILTASDLEERLGRLERERG